MSAAKSFIAFLRFGKRSGGTGVSVLEPRPSIAVAGLFFGMVTVLLWSIFNVGMKVAYADGFRPVDLVFLRYVGGAITLLPIFFLTRSRLPPLKYLLALTLLVGPPYFVLLSTGFSYAPLGHALVVPPSVAMISSNVFAMVFDGDVLSRRRATGMALLIVGLIAISSETTGAGAGSPLIGDMFFAGSGTLWGSYTYLMSRWRLAAVPTASGIATISALIFLPLYLAFYGIPDLAPAKWAEQAVYQGVLGGALGFVAFAATVARLGAGRAGLFFALVPPTALLIAIPMVGSLPTPLQMIAICFAAAGIVVSLELRTMRR